MTRCCANAAWSRAGGVRREISVDWLGQNAALPMPSNASSAYACHGSLTSGSNPNPRAWITRPPRSTRFAPRRSITGPIATPAVNCAADEIAIAIPAVAIPNPRTSVR